jgi:NRPS condensation-like uncharacterized protein
MAPPPVPPPAEAIPVPGRTLPPTRRFSPLEDAIAHAGRPGAPMTMGFTLVPSGHLDPRHLDAALDAALLACPMLRARRQRLGRWQRWPRWEWPDDVEPRVVSRRWTPGTPLESVWRVVLAEPLALDQPPLVRVVHLQGERRDALLVAVHHAAVDGRGGLLFLQHLAAAYTELDGTVHRDGLRVVGVVGDGSGGPRAGSGGGVGPAGALPPPARSSLFDVVRAPRAARVAGRAVPPDEGGSPCRVTHRWLDGDASVAVTAAARCAGVTVTDLLVAALHLAIHDWNTARRLPPDLVTVTVPVRAERGLGGDPADPATNRTVQITTQTARPHRVDPARTLSAVSEQLGAVRAQATLPPDPTHAPGEPAASSVLALLPERWRRRVPAMASALTGDRFLASSRLSNLGAVPGPTLDFGTVTTVDLGFSTPVRMPQGVTLGVVGFGGRLQLAFRWCEALWDGAEAEQFADVYLAALRRLSP